MQKSGVPGVTIIVEFAKGENMKIRRILFTAVICALLLFFSGCFFPGTGWLIIYNNIADEYGITELYVYELQSDSHIGDNLLEDESPSVMNFGDYITEYNLSPGNYAIQGSGFRYQAGTGLVPFTFSTAGLIEADVSSTVFIVLGDVK